MSQPKASVIPRKAPKQARSKMTVEAIIEAAAYILIEQGWDNLTTNAVAERAGVNIGSLYQYFPNKLAIAAEVQRSHVARVRQIVLDALPELTRQPSPRAALTVLVRALLQAQNTAPEMHRAIAEELPRSVFCEADPGPLEQALTEALAPMMTNVPDPQQAVRILFVATRAIIHEATLYRPEMGRHPGFVDEVVCLLESYLTRS